MIPVDFLSPTLIKKLTQESNNYRIYDVFATPKGAPVVIQKSNAVDPAHWRIIDRTSSIFFLSFSDVQNYIRNRGLMPSTEYAKTHNKNWRF